MPRKKSATGPLSNRRRAPLSPTNQVRLDLRLEGQENWLLRKKILADKSRMDIYCRSVQLLIDKKSGLTDEEFSELGHFKEGAENLANNSRTRKKRYYRSLVSKLKKLETAADQLPPRKK